jgi:hypothetical protein
MSTAGKARPKNVDRYWHQVESEPQRAHAYVSLLGLRTMRPENFTPASAMASRMTRSRSSGGF